MTTEGFPGEDAPRVPVQTPQEVALADEPLVLPEIHGLYFNLDLPHEVVPLDHLVSSKTDEENAKGGANAVWRMAEAARGDRERRNPITVEPVGDQRYLIIDGNGTYTAVRRMGWLSLPAQVKRTVPPN